MAELRRGGIVVLRGEDGSGGLVIAAESCGPRALQRLQGLAQNAPVLVTTRRRAEAIGMDIPPHIAGGMGETNKPITLDLPEGVPVDIILQPHEAENAGRHVALQLTCRGRSPATRLRSPRPRSNSPSFPACCPPSCWDRSAAIPATSGASGRATRTSSTSMPPMSPPTKETASRNLQQVAQAHVPLEGAENARILAWRPSDGGKEHLAIVVGEIDSTEPVLIRLHSECFTGDLLGIAALRLRRATARRHRPDRAARLGRSALSRRRRDRGIGLVNKLRAYELQDDGFDTIDANEQLGFDADERIYAPAATMLGPHGHQARAADDQQSGKDCATRALRRRGRGARAALLPLQRDTTRTIFAPRRSEQATCSKTRRTTGGKR